MEKEKTLQRESGEVVDMVETSGAVWVSQLASQVCLQDLPEWLHILILNNNQLATGPYDVCTVSWRAGGVEGQKRLN